MLLQPVVKARAALDGRRREDELGRRSVTAWERLWYPCATDPGATGMGRGVMVELKEQIQQREGRDFSH